MIWAGVGVLVGGMFLIAVFLMGYGHTPIGGANMPSGVRIAVGLRNITGVIGVAGVLAVGHVWFPTAPKVALVVVSVIAMVVGALICDVLVGRRLIHGYDGPATDGDVVMGRR